jgi:hypothetical protein
MIIFFTCPRAFNEEYNIGQIQKNAILSWKKLDIEKKIILIGDEEGSEDFCKKYDLIYESNVEKNEFGTPLIDSIFKLGLSYSNENDILCYINTDIILDEKFSEMINNIHDFIEENKNFLISGIRTNIYELVDFENNDQWKKQIKKFEDHRPTAIDYFIFSKNTYDINQIPKFAIGKFAFDNWLLNYVIMKKYPTINCSNCVKVYHQMAPWFITNKFYERGDKSILNNSQVIENKKLFRNSSYGKKIYSLNDIL